MGHNWKRNEIIEVEGRAEVVLINRQHEEVGRAIIDVEDIGLVGQHRWSVGTYGYAMTSCGSKRIAMHRMLSDPSWSEVDHINRNRLDNRRCNLRPCSRSQNSMNRSKRSDNTSGVPGVVWDGRTSKWSAQYKKNGITKHIGRFDTIEAAIEARRAAEQRYFGEFAPQH